MKINKQCSYLSDVGDPLGQGLEGLVPLTALAEPTPPQLQEAEDEVEELADHSEEEEGEQGEDARVPAPCIVPLKHNQHASFSCEE